MQVKISWCSSQVVSVELAPGAGVFLFRLREPARAEFLRSATDPAHRDEPAEESDALCVFSPVLARSEEPRYELTQ
ncbi:hypothetical protein [Streptomyces sp. MBT53]|uniref:hypothetical protein n=1 Tax=Streptomyces sp. MBT53 TaxID=1488384 RepID=UPI001914D0F9|nr:hypothetical protein [Streptomyces sp. MBT53]